MEIPKNDAGDDQGASIQKYKISLPQKFLLLEEKRRADPNHHAQQRYPDRRLQADLDGAQVVRVLEDSNPLRTGRREPIEGEAIPGQRRKVRNC